MKPEILKKNGNLELCELTPELTECIDALFAWENDESTRHLHLVTRSEKEFKELQITRESLLKRIETAQTSDNFFLWMILENKKPVCFLTAQIDPRQLLRHVPGTFWPSLLIGEKSARGRGIGKQAMLWLEEIAGEMGCKRIEIGVFEFNTAARRLYESLGYVEFAQTPEFTWWNGALRTDLRLEKDLKNR